MNIKEGRGVYICKFKLLICVPFPVQSKIFIPGYCSHKINFEDPWRIVFKSMLLIMQFIRYLNNLLLHLNEMCHIGNYKEHVN